MRVVQFESVTGGRRLGVVRDTVVLDVTAVHASVTRVADAFTQAYSLGIPLAEHMNGLASAAGIPELDYEELRSHRSPDDGPVLRAPLDHVDPHRLLVTGTGLTHTGSMESRDQMHAAEPVEEEDETSKSDSKKMFEMGLAGGKPESGQRGAAPEWFYKGNGFNLRSHGEPLDVPDFALDGGEEPELVGCYIIDPNGIPRRLGFALGNEWSDHATENINYLYLAPSKLRTCAVGPELVLDCDFQHIDLQCTISRDGDVIYDSGPLLSGEDHMSHSLANCEDHHFKYPQHRVPGDVHLHYFGTSRLSHSTRDWKFADGDEIRIDAPEFSASLVNTVRRSVKPKSAPVQVRSA